MPTLALAPRFSLTPERLHGCTPWLARLFTLFSYGRCLSVNKPLGHLIVSTRRFWISREVRVINFDRIERIVYRAQALPSLALWRYFASANTSRGGWTFFLVSLEIKDEAKEVQLFTIWQSAPQAPDWLDRMAGDTDTDQQLGDEAARALIDALIELTGARAVSD